MFINVHLQPNEPMERRLAARGDTIGMLERFRNGCLNSSTARRMLHTRLLCHTQLNTDVV